MKGVEHHVPGLLGDLLDRPFANWKTFIHRAHPSFMESVTEDPIPAPLVQALGELDSNRLLRLVEELRALPLRRAPTLRSDSRRPGTRSPRRWRRSGNWRSSRPTLPRRC